MTRQGPAGFAGKRGLGWVLLASWTVPVVMTGAYLVLMATSETDATGKAWEAIGLAFVLVVWFLFRLLTESAAIHRALAVGDADRVLELADYQLARRRSPAARAPLHIYRAQAFELRGQWREALAALAEARLDALRGTSGRGWQLLAATVRIAALVETGQVAEARAALDRDVEPSVARLHPRLQAQSHILANLARGQVLWAEGAHAAAQAALQKVLDDVRTGASTRAQAYLYAARCADALGDAITAGRYQARSAELSMRR